VGRDRVDVEHRDPTCWCALYGAWIGTAALVLAALFGTSSLTPIAGAGRAGAGWQEAVVVLGLTTSAVAMVACCVLVLLNLTAGSGSASGASIERYVLTPTPHLALLHPDSRAHDRARAGRPGS